MTAEPGRIRVGIGGWTYEPWRETFYPSDLPKRDELAYASRRVTSIEVNATYYRTQTPQTFRRWADETPDGFVFALKASRYATNRKDLADGGEAVTRFLGSGLTELGAKLGPILWQLAPTKRFDASEIEGFLERLPRTQDGLALRHVLEVRHPSFATQDFVAAARRHGVAICLAISEDYPQIADPTADFVYLRLQTTSDLEENGYDAETIGHWAERLATFASGGIPKDMALVGGDVTATPRDCFAFVIAGAKDRNPGAAMALIAKLDR